MALKSIVIKTTDSIKTIYGAFADEATQSDTLHYPPMFYQVSFVRSLGRLQANNLVFAKPALEHQGKASLSNP